MDLDMIIRELEAEREQLRDAIMAVERLQTLRQQQEYLRQTPDRHRRHAEDQERTGDGEYPLVRT